MKIFALKFFLGVVFVCTMAAGIWLEEKEADIIYAQSKMPHGKENSPIDIKGVIFYVSHTDLVLYEIYRDVFAIGCVGNLVLASALNRLIKNR